MSNDNSDVPAPHWVANDTPAPVEQNANVEADNRPEDEDASAADVSGSGDSEIDQEIARARRNS